MHWQSAMGGLCGKTTEMPLRIWLLYIFGLNMDLLTRNSPR